MNVADINNWVTTIWAPGMLRACEQGALAVAIVWVACRLFPRLPSPLRAALWWLVCLKTLISISVVGPIPLAVLPAKLQSAPSTTHPVAAKPTFPNTVSTTISVRSVDKDIPTRTPPGNLKTSTGERKVALPIAGNLLIDLVFCLWLFGVGFILVKTVGGLLSMRHLVKGARPGCGLSVLHEVAEALGLHRTPTVLISDHADCSLVTGLWRPIVVLCRADMERLSQEEMRALLAHELAHIRRRDLWAGLLPNLVRLVFFFNPLVWLACREYDRARETACDAEALQVSGISPAAYGRLLLKLGIGFKFAPAGISSAALGAASPHGAQLRQRIEGLRWHYCPRPKWMAPILLPLAVGLFCVHPVRVSAKPGPPVPPATMPTASTANNPRMNRPAVVAKAPLGAGRVTHDTSILDVLPALSPQTYSTLTSSPVRAVDSAQSRNISRLKKEDTPMLNLAKLRKPKLPAAATTVPLAAAGMPLLVPPAAAQDAPSIAMPPVAQVQENTQKPRYQYTLKLGNSYINHTRDKEVDAGHQALAKAQAGDCLIVDWNGKRYLVTDAATINRTKESYEKVEAISKQMDGLGKKMDEVSKPMDALGNQMDELGKQMESIGKQLDEQGELLEAAHQDNKPDAERKAIQDKMHAIQEKMKAPQREMRATQEKMKVLQQEMRAHSDQMRDYGNKMRSAIKEAEAKVFDAIDAAFQNNLAVEQKMS